MVNFGGTVFDKAPTYCNILLVNAVPGDFPRCTVIESLISVTYFRQNTREPFAVKDSQVDGYLE